MVGNDKLEYNSEMKEKFVKKPLEESKNTIDNKLWKNKFDFGTADKEMYNTIYNSEFPEKKKEECEKIDINLKNIGSIEFGNDPNNFVTEARDKY